jgi:hypothetical protein
MTAAWRSTPAHPEGLGRGDPHQDLTAGLIQDTHVLPVARVGYDPVGQRFTLSAASAGSIPLGDRRGK